MGEGREAQAVKPAHFDKRMGARPSPCITGDPFRVTIRRGALWYSFLSSLNTHASLGHALKSASHRVVSSRKEKAMKKDTELGLLGMLIMFPIGLMIAVAPLWM